MKPISIPTTAPVVIAIEPGMEPYAGNLGKFVTTGILGKDWSPAQGWLVSEDPPRIRFADGEIVPADGKGCAVVGNPPERPAGICYCIDCGGDQPGHEDGCEFMLELHGCASVSVVIGTYTHGPTGGLVRTVRVAGDSEALATIKRQMISHAKSDGAQVDLGVFRCPIETKR